MKDFTMSAYEAYIRAISGSYSKIITFDRYFREDNALEEFCIIRHDVDRYPSRAFKMAEMEYYMGISSTYYFRSKRNTFRPNLMSAIHRMGHEVGYHYECLSDAKGIGEEAIRDFERQISKFKKIVPISTIAMHGRPLSIHDNRDMWNCPESKKALHEKYGVLGEVYIDVDYSGILYISDTGRNWKTATANRRDRVDSKINVDFENGEQLIHYLSGRPHPRLVFQVHPERWTDDCFVYIIQWVFDKAINLAKAIQWEKK